MKLGEDYKKTCNSCKNLEVSSEFLFPRFGKAKHLKKLEKNHPLKPHLGNILISRISRVDFTVTNWIKDLPSTLSIEVTPQSFMLAIMKSISMLG